MGLFKKTPFMANLGPAIKSPIPLEHIDITKRYDIYCNVANEYRLYPNVKIVARKTLEDIREAFSAFNVFLEIEDSEGTRAMVPLFPIHAICEHGSTPKYVVLKKPPESP
jgi:hypothetical protein